MIIGPDDFPFGSVCSGIEAASEAFIPLGWRPTFYSEIEPFPCAVLKHHHPNIPNFGDMTRFKEWPDVAIRLLVGGTPCQSFSVAGLRAGLADPRGNLMLTFLAIADRYRPEWLVWENVPGVLSSGEGRDFGALLGRLAELGYGFAYRVLDAQHFGVPQRRRRVFVVGNLRDWRRAAAVLFERESLRGDSAPSREAGEEITPTIRAGAANGGAEHGARSGDSKDELIVSIAPTIPARTRGGGGLGTDFDCDGGLIHCPPIVPQAMNRKWSKGSSGPAGDEIANLIAFDTTQITSAANYSSPRPGDPCHPLAAGAYPPAIAFDSKATHAGEGTVSPTLRAMGHDQSHANGGGQIAVAIRTAQTSANGHGVSEEVAHTLDGAQGQAIAFSGRNRGAEPKLNRPERPPHCMEEMTGAIDSTKPWNVAADMQVRRLTPRECERLQGFPDDHTLIPYRGKFSADGPRYKALGNSMAVPVMRWIGERIKLIDSL